MSRACDITVYTAQHRSAIYTHLDTAIDLRCSSRHAGNQYMYVARSGVNTWDVSQVASDSSNGWPRRYACSWRSAMSGSQLVALTPPNPPLSPGERLRCPMCFVLLPSNTCRA